MLLGHIGLIIAFVCGLAVGYMIALYHVNTGPRPE